MDKGLFRLVECEKCHGKGKYKKAVWVQTPVRYDDNTRKKAYQLFLKRKSFREIAKELGIKHPQTVKNLVDKHIQSL